MTFTQAVTVLVENKYKEITMYNLNTLQILKLNEAGRLIEVSIEGFESMLDVKAEYFLDDQWHIGISDD